LSSFWAITKNSFIEIIRQPVYAILLVGAMVLIGFSPAVTMFSLVEDEKLMVDMGLATMMLLGLVMAVLSSTQVITREIESKTVGAVVSKPVGRFVFIAAKFLAVSLAMAVATYMVTIILLMAVRMGVPSSAKYMMDWPALVAEVAPLLIAILLGVYVNFFYRWSFTSSAIVFALVGYTVAFGLLLIIGPNWHLQLVPAVFGERHCMQLVQAALLVFLGIWVLSAVAMALSTRLNVVVNAIACVALFFVGMIAQYLFSATPWPAWIAWLAPIMLRLVPNLYVFWVADQLMMKAPIIPWDYVGAAALYACGFCLAMVFFAGFLFERREVV